MLIENHQSDHNDIQPLLCECINRGKLNNSSKAILLIVQYLEKAFQFSSVVELVQESQLHTNLAHNIVEYARKSIQLKSRLFFFPSSIQ